MHGEATLRVVDESEVLARLLDGDHVHESRRVGWVGPNLAINFDEALLDDGCGLSGVECILQSVVVSRLMSDRCVRGPESVRVAENLPVTDEDDERQAVSELVRTG